MINLHEVIKGCKKGNRDSQKLLYQHFYSYAMSICRRYTLEQEMALEICNDGFMKIFRKISYCNDENTFKAWLRKIMINTAIDYFRKHKEVHKTYQIDHLQHLPQVNITTKEDVLSKIANDEIVKLIQCLSPMYRTVFNLYVIDGYSHEEISNKLSISIGASKSNLSRARDNLRKMLQKIFDLEYAKYTG